MKLPYHAKTNCGWDAVVTCIDAPGNCPIVGDIIKPDGSRWPVSWVADGRWIDDDKASPFDLIDFPPVDPAPDPAVNTDSEDRIIVINGQQFRVPYEVAELIDGLKDAAPQETAWKPYRFVREEPCGCSHFAESANCITGVVTCLYCGKVVARIVDNIGPPPPAAAPTDNTALVEALLADHRTTCRIARLDPATTTTTASRAAAALASRPAEATSSEPVGADMPERIFAYPDKEWTFHRGVGRGVEYIRPAERDALVERLTAERDALVVALQPFAKCADELDIETKELGREWADDEWAKFRLLVSDYRRARAALAKLDEEANHG
ncbi:hypothetical protein [Frigidibacter oleivorans]|uniref:hypothetical protein n=1 Tax=Frigidibacter oleivorans TaxID=2487129 RepID=UPI000F8E4985|nr:hypothetical protein [Frigidibacter oleivorans]